MKFGNLNFLETSGPVQACSGTALPCINFINICPIMQQATRHFSALVTFWHTLQNLKHKITWKIKHQKYVSFGATAPQWARASSFTRFLDQTQRRITVGRTPLQERSARRRDLYLTTYNTHNRQKSMPFSGIRTHNLSRRAAAGLRLRPRGYWDRH